MRKHEWDVQKTSNTKQTKISEKNSYEVTIQVSSMDRQILRQSQKVIHLTVNWTKYFKVIPPNEVLCFFYCY